MKLKLQMNWRSAAKSSFSPDAVRRNGTPFRNKKLLCLVPKNGDNNVASMKEWFVNNEVTEFEMCGVYHDSPDGKMYYLGIAFEFKNEQDTMMFKLTFM
jgi:hypothetical protein